MTWDSELLPVSGSAKWLPGKPWEIYFIVFLTSHVLRRSDRIRGIIPILLIVNDVQSFCPTWHAWCGKDIENVNETSFDRGKAQPYTKTVTEPITCEIQWHAEIFRIRKMNHYINCLITTNKEFGKSIACEHKTMKPLSTASVHSVNKICTWQHTNIFF